MWCASWATPMRRGQSRLLGALSSRSILVSRSNTAPGASVSGAVLLLWRFNSASSQSPVQPHTHAGSSTSHPQRLNTNADARYAVLASLPGFEFNQAMCHTPLPVAPRPASPRHTTSSSSSSMNHLSLAGQTTIKVSVTSLLADKADKSANSAWHVTLLNISHDDQCKARWQLQRCSV